MTPYKEVNEVKALFTDPAFNDTRKKLWHGTLIIAVAYAQTKPNLAWLIPALVAIASMSDVPLGGVKK